MARAYVDARQEHGKSQLLDEIITAKPTAITPTITLPKSSKTTDSTTCVIRWPCLETRPLPQRSMNTGDSLSRCRTRLRRRTGGNGQDESEAELTAINDITEALGSGAA